MMHDNKKANIEEYSRTRRESAKLTKANSNELTLISNSRARRESAKLAKAYRHRRSIRQPITAPTSILKGGSDHNNLNDHHVPTGNHHRMLEYSRARRESAKIAKSNKELSIRSNNENMIEYSRARRESAKMAERISNNSNHELILSPTFHNNDESEQVATTMTQNKVDHPVVECNSVTYRSNPAKVLSPKYTTVDTSSSLPVTPGAVYVIEEQPTPPSFRFPPRSSRNNIVETGTPETTASSIFTDYEDNSNHFLAASELNNEERTEAEINPPHDEGDGEMVKQTKKEKFSLIVQQSWELMLFISIIFVVFITVGVVLLKVVFSNQGENNESSLSVEDFKDIVPKYTRLSWKDPSSPQSAALSWLQSDPQFLSYSNSRKLSRFALAALYFSTNGPKWNTKTHWLSYDIHECQWYSTNNYPVCQNLELISNGLQGTVPLEVGILKSLNRIDLGGNKISGSIPSQIGSLTNLEFFRVGSNSITGAVPTEIGALVNLKELNLQSNSITGTLPTEVGMLNSLTTLNITSNKLDGTIPSSVGLLTNLEILSIQDNILQGSLPTQVGDLTKIEILEIGNNVLTGMIPSELRQLSNMEYLRFQKNFFVGNIPTGIGFLTSLILFHVSMNSLTGRIPSEVGNMSNMKFLDVSSNHLSGTIPKEVGLLTNRLYELELQSNSFSGTIPTELGNLNTLRFLYLQENNFTGTIPSQIGNMERLRWFLVHDNSLSGDLPSELGKLTNAQVWSFSNNHLIGTLPSALDGAEYLERLHIFNNTLTGTVPNELCSLVERNWLHEIIVDCDMVYCDCGCTCGDSL